MIPLRLSAICTALELPVPERDVTIDAVVTDSRKVRYGALLGI